MKRHIIPGAVVLMILVSGIQAWAMSQAPTTVEGTRILVREGDRGSDYVARIGRSETTEISAVLEGNGYWRLEYSYADDEWLEATELRIMMVSTSPSIPSEEPARVEGDDGLKAEFDSIEVRRNLFERMLESPQTTINLVGNNGVVIIEMGTESRSRLQELLDFGAENFGD